MVVQVIRRIRVEILLTQRASGAAKAVQDGRIDLQIGELAGIVQTVVNNARNGRALAVHLRLALNQRGNSHNIVHRSAECVCARLDLFIILIPEVVEHGVDRVPNRCVALIDLIGIREQIALQPALLGRELALQELMLESIGVEFLVQRILRADMLIQQQLLDLRDGVALRNRDLHGLCARHIDQGINDLSIVHIGVQRIAACQHALVITLDADIQLEDRSVVDHALVVQLVGQRKQIGIFRHGNLLDCIILDKGKHVVGNKDCRKRKHDRNTEHRDHIDHRTGTAAVFHTPAAPAALIRLRDALRLLVDVVIHILHVSTSLVLFSC